ncbi:hypothetical protein DXG03_002784 [Asterophora parasitica]|uniref:RPA43 OB domain-containing protein n=1 Tax=Asterophora parasitica TaxID=117018 RepID=A0A9P7G5E2_9AGAR|nr:hypothetical protein DXG03_002784 [Asterophora parasitica]
MPEPTTSTTTKKRKQTAAAVDVPAKKSKKDGKDKKEKKEKKEKGKARGDAAHTDANADSEFHVVKTELVVSIAPVFVGNPRAGVEEMLDSMVMRYIPALRGVVLSHSNLRFLSTTATIKADCPFLVSKIEFDATIWSPRVGMKLGMSMINQFWTVGKVNLCSPDHVSLLLHRTFNVSIPRHHLPKGEWDFEYGPAENDPEFGPDVDADEGGPGEKAEGDGGGKWVHHLTNAKLGGADGFLEFTVIGLTVANEMLSLLGSIQPDPFSPLHKPESSAAEKHQTESEQEDIEVEQAIQPWGDDENDDGAEEDEVDTDEEDTFKALGKMTDEASKAEAGRRAAEEAARADKEKKRKRKAENAEKSEGKKKRSKS